MLRICLSRAVDRCSVSRVASRLAQQMIHQCRRCAEENKSQHVTARRGKRGIHQAVSSHCYQAAEQADCHTVLAETTSACQRRVGNLPGGCYQARAQSQPQCDQRYCAADAEVHRCL